MDFEKNVRCLTLEEKDYFLRRPIPVPTSVEEGWHKAYVHYVRDVERYDSSLPSGKTQELQLQFIVEEDSCEVPINYAVTISWDKDSEFYRLLKAFEELPGEGKFFDSTVLIDLGLTILVNNKMVGDEVYSVIKDFKKYNGVEDWVK